MKINKVMNVLKRKTVLKLARPYLSTENAKLVSIFFLFVNI